MDILVTGSKSGLGRFLQEWFNCYGYTRENRIEDLKIPYQTIIHCAFDPIKKLNSDNINRYIEDNFLLTKRLVTELNFQKFIYISSVDIYPKDEERHIEEEVISLENPVNAYTLVKLISEAFIEKHCKNYLIIRAGLLLGKYSRVNNLINLLKEPAPVLSLTGESTFNCVLHSDIYEFIRLAINKDLSGIYNAVSETVISLKLIADKYKKMPQYGSFTYKCGNIDNNKIKKLCSIFNKTSENAVEQFIRECL